MTTLESRGPAFAAFVLRVLSGVAFLAHGLYLKIFVFTMPGTVGFFESLGLPGFSAWLVMLGEAVGGLLLILGLWVRPASLWLIAILLGAVWTHAPNGWVFSAPNGGWEYPLFWAGVQLAILLLGPGAFALRGAVPGAGAQRAAA
jgi:putative oxidoreductase